MKQYITRDTIVTDVLDEHPEAAEILRAIGMRFPDGPEARGMTVKDACAVCHIDADTVVDEINMKIEADR